MIPRDLIIDARQQRIVLSWRGKTVEIDNGGHYGVFARGPISWENLELAYLRPALWHLGIVDKDGNVIEEKP